MGVITEKEVDRFFAEDSMGRRDRKGAEPYGAADMARARG